MLTRTFFCTLIASLVLMSALCVFAEGEAEVSMVQETEYASQGLESVLPSRFYEAPTITQSAELGITEINPSLFAGMEYNRPQTGSGYHDRLSAHLRIRHELGPFGLGAKYRYVHSIAPGRFINGDTQMIVANADVQLDVLKPYVFSVLSIASRVDGGTKLFGGGGVKITAPVHLPLIENFGFDVSIIDSLAHQGDRVSTIRGQIEATVSIDIDRCDLTLVPFFGGEKDLRSPGYYTFAGVTSHY